MFLTTDKGIKYQQNMSGRSVAAITLRAKKNSIEMLIPLMPQVHALLPMVQLGHVYVVEELSEEAAEPNLEI